MIKHLKFLLAAFIALPGTAHATLSWTSSGPGGGGAFAGAAISPANTNHVIVPSDLGGIYRSTNGGAGWTAIGSNKLLLDTHVDAVAFHPSIDGTVYLGTGNGIYRSTDCQVAAGACTFARASVNGSTAALSRLITAISPASSGTAAATTVYAAGIDSWCDAGLHLYKSTNNGAAWTELATTGLPSNANIMAIRVQPGNANTIIAVSAASRFTGCGAGSNFPVEAPNRAFKSTDGGLSFTPMWISSGVPTLLQSDSVTAGSWAYVEDVKFDKVNANKVWATVTANPVNASSWNINGELWMSDGTTGVGNDLQWQSGERTGQIWPLSTGTVRVVDLRRQHPWDTGENGVWEFATGTGFWSRVTTDADYLNWGRGWHGLANGPSASLNGYLHSITPVNDTTLWWTDSQFAYKAIDGGHIFNQQFTNATTSVPTSYYSRKIDNAVAGVLVRSPLNADVMYAGYFDMGCWRSQDSGPTSTNPSWIDCNGPKSLAPSYPDSVLNGGWKGYGGNTTAIAHDPSVAGTVWAVHSPQNDAVGASGSGFYKIGKSTDSGVNWVDVTNNLNAAGLANNNAITDMLVQPQPTAAARRLWAIANRKLFKLENGSSVWAQVVTPCDGGLIVMSQSGAQMLAGGGGGVCWSNNNGTTWAKWTPAWTNTAVNNWWTDGQDIGGVYTKYRGVTDFAFHPTNNQIAWATVMIPNTGANEANAGLYKTINGGAAWTKVATLPAAAALGMNYARTVAVSPANSNLLVVGNSTALMSGGLSLPTQQTGVWVSTNGGTSWTAAPQNAGLAFPFMTRMRFTGGTTPRLWGISPGQGLVYTSAP
jgi:hypothetical protein